MPALAWRATLALLGRLPAGSLSRGFGRIADLPLPRSLRRTILGTFARAVGIDVEEAELPLEAYPSLNRFFVRRLQPGLRVWPDDPHVAGSPVDGIIGQFGAIRQGTLVQAKGRTYTAAELIGDAADARRYDRGTFVTLYLSPRHYHRIHAPCSGGISSARYVPGALLPVNAPAVMHVERLFPRNERLMCAIDGGLGRVAIVAVGAYNVGRISAAFDPAWNGGENGWVTNQRGAAIDSLSYAPPIPVTRGDEIMAFHLGSTVVLLFEPGVTLGSLSAGGEIRLGAPIAAGRDTSRDDHR